MPFILRSLWLCKWRKYRDVRTTVLLAYPNAGYTEVEAKSLAQILKTISEHKQGGTCIQFDASRLFTKHTYSLRRLPGAFAWVLGFLASTHSPLGIQRVQDYPTRQAKGDEWKQSRKKEDFYEDPLVICVSTVPEGLRDGLHYLERPKVTFLVFKAIQITAGHWRHVLPPDFKTGFSFQHGQAWLGSNSCLPSLTRWKSIDDA